MSYSPIIVIAGPTATGKTKLAQSLAKEFDGYIINADSRQIYKELNIGTAKPTQEEIEKSGVEHHLFGHVSIAEEYNLYRYQKEAKDLLKKNRQKVAFLVGGTGLYIDSIVYNYHLQKDQKDLKNLQNMKVKELQNMIGDDIYKLNESDRNNPRRLSRFLQRGKNKFGKGEELKHLYSVYYDDFENIEKSIKDRIERMFKKGLVEENQELKDYNLNGTIGYQEFKDYFYGKAKLEEVKNEIYLNTRKYAKRQLTWFKRNSNAIWVQDYKTAKEECKKKLYN